MEVSKNHLIAAGIVLALMLIEGVALAGGAYVYAQHARLEASADALAKAKDAENDRLKSENRTLKESNDALTKQTKEFTDRIDALRVEVQKSPVAARRAINEELASRGLGATVEQAASDGGQPDTLLTPAQQQGVADALLAGQEDAKKLGACEAKLANDENIIANDAVVESNQKEEIAGYKKIKHPGFFHSTWGFIKTAVPSIVVGILLSKAKR